MGCNERELFSRSQVTEWDVCGSCRQTSGAPIMRADLQEGTSARKDQQALIKLRDRPHLPQPQAPQQMPEEHPSSTSGVTRELAAHPWGKIGGGGKGLVLTGAKRPHSPPHTQRLYC